MKRRTFLKLSALGASAIALQSWQASWAQSEIQDLIVISNAGNAEAGIDPSVSLLDPVNLQVIKTLPFPTSYSFPASRWDFARDIIWTGAPGGKNKSVQAYRLSTGEQLLELPTNSSQNYTELTPDGKFLIVSARYADKFLKISADPEASNFGQVVAEIEHYQGSQPCDMSITADGLYAYIPDRGGDTLTTLRLDPFEIVSTKPMKAFYGLPLEPYMGTVSPIGNYLFIENATVENAFDKGSESIFDLSNPEKPKEVARLNQLAGLGEIPVSSEFTTDGRYGIVICRGSASLSIIDTTITPLQPIKNVEFPKGSSPIAGTFGNTDDMFFVPLPGRDAVAAVSVPEFEVVELIPVGQRPLGAIYLQTAVPERMGLFTPVGVALAEGRTFAANCPDRCCGNV